LDTEDFESQECSDIRRLRQFCSGGVPWRSHFSWNKPVLASEDIARKADDFLITDPERAYNIIQLLLVYHNSIRDLKPSPEEPVKYKAFLETKKAIEQDLKNLFEGGHVQIAVELD